MDSELIVSQVQSIDINFRSRVLETLDLKIDSSIDGA